MTALNTEINPNSIILSMSVLAPRKNNDGKTIPSYFTQEFKYYPFTQSILRRTEGFSVARLASGRFRSILPKEVKTFSPIVRGILKSNIERVNTSATICIFSFDENMNTHACILRGTSKLGIWGIASYSNPDQILKSQYEEAIDYLLNNDPNSKIYIFKELMRVGKSIDNKKTKEEVEIDGQNVLINLVAKDGGILSSVNIIDEFENYDKQYEFCLENLRFLSQHELAFCFCIKLRWW